MERPQIRRGLRIVVLGLEIAWAAYMPGNVNAQDQGPVGLAACSGGVELRLFEIETGQTAVVGQIAGLCSLIPSANAVDLDTGLMYQIGFETGVVDSARLFVINPSDGTLVRKLPVEQGLVNLRCRQDGALVGLRWRGDAEELCSLDAGTGETSVLGTIPGLSGVVPAANALDQRSDVMFQVGFAAGDPATPRLYRIDARAGTLLGEAPLDAWFNVLRLTSAGDLIGLTWAHGEEELHAIDPTTGASEPLASIPDLHFLISAANSMDGGSNRVCQLGSTQGVGGSPTLFVVNANDGSLLGNPGADREFSNLRSVETTIQPGLLQSSESRWVVDHVEVHWTLVRVPATHTLERRVGGTGTYEPISAPALHLVDTHYTYSDFNTTPGQTYGYRVTVHGVLGADAQFETEISTPELTFALQSNWPNPFREETRIAYSLDADSEVSIVVYDVSGRRVRTLVHARQPAGFYATAWDGRDGEGDQVASGAYLLRLQAGDRERSRKIVVLR
jgi:hypothetical protein